MAYRQSVPGGDAFQPDLAAATTDLERLVRRLRSLSQRSWRERRAAAQAALDGLAALDARLEGRQLDTPTVPEHALADALAVIGGDVLDAIAMLDDRSALDTTIHLLEVALERTR